VQIHAVTQAAYTLEAERIGCADFPPLRESLNELRDSSDSFLIFQEAGIIVGALSFHRSPEAVDITRLVVSPAHHRKGIATALLAELEQRTSPVARLTVSTALNNTPAVSLYRKLGYVTARISNSAEGIPLLHLTKCKDRNGEGVLEK
jgi:ribosomal protein S18 acetylase RimI-like enzyme